MNSEFASEFAATLTLAQSAAQEAEAEESRLHEVQLRAARDRIAEQARDGLFKKATFAITTRKITMVFSMWWELTARAKRRQRVLARAIGRRASSMLAYGWGTWCDYVAVEVEAKREAETARQQEQALEKMRAELQARTHRRQLERRRAAMAAFFITLHGEMLRTKCKQQVLEQAVIQLRHKRAMGRVYRSWYAHSRQIQSKKRALGHCVLKHTRRRVGSVYYSWCDYTMQCRQRLKRLTHGHLARNFHSWSVAVAVRLEHRAAAKIQAMYRGFIARHQVINISALKYADSSDDCAAGESESALSQFLQTVPLLTRLQPGELENLAAASTLERYEDEDVVTQGCQDGTSMFIVKRGVAVAEKDGLEVRTYHSGDYFGELALISGNARQATVRAAGPVECVRLDSGSFAANVGRYPHVAEAFKEQELAYMRTGSKLDADPQSGVRAVPDGDAEVGTPERSRSTTQQWLQASQENAAILASHLLQDKHRAGHVLHELHSSKAALASPQTPARPAGVAAEGLATPSPFSVSESLKKELDQLWRNEAPQAVNGKLLQQEATAVGISEGLPPTPWLLEEAESRVRASLRKQPPGTPVRQ
jgi:CRP-like cAMP-binding protein